MRYPLLEAAGAVLALQRGDHLAGGRLLYCLRMALLALIDSDTLLLPDQTTLPLVWLGLAAAFAFDATPTPVQAVLGAAGDYLVLWAFY